MDYQNCVIDLSHNNGDVSSFHEVKAAGVQGVIHKVSEGLGFVDGQYASRRVRALSVDLLWGGYHFGRDADGAAQAAHFLANAAVDASTLMALDWENPPDGDPMTTAQANAFIHAVHVATGRVPKLYSGESFLTDRCSEISDGDPLTYCELWIARYGAEPVVPDCWDKWALWQYTNGQIGQEPHGVAGVGNCDRDFFNPAAGTLQEFWMR